MPREVDHYEPSGRRSPPPPPSTSRRSPPPPPPPPTGPRAFTGDSNSRYAKTEFSFGGNDRAPQYPDDHHGDSYRPSYNDRAPRRGGRNDGGRGGRGGRGGYGQMPRKPFVPKPAHERAILHFDYREKTPELLPGMVTGGFAAAEEGEGAEGEKEQEVEDDAGSVMSMSDDDGDNEVKVHPETVVTVLEPAPANTADKPVWTEDTTGAAAPTEEKKKVDVIEMIRQAKAKAAAEKAPPVDHVAANDDFISLNFEDPSPEESDSEDSNYRRDGKTRRLNDGTREANPEHSFSHRDHLHGPYESKDTGPPGVPQNRPPNRLPPPPSRTGKERSDQRKRQREEEEHDDYDDYDDYQYTNPNDDIELPGLHQDVPAGRKRKHAQISRANGKNAADGNITREFLAKPGRDPVPWVKGTDHHRSVDMNTWLHKEIIDFVRYLEPRPFEQAVRMHLINRIRTTITSMWPDTDIRVFGSFAANLYLPTSDIDLVVLSTSFARHRTPKYASTRTLHIIANCLRNAGFVQYGTLQVISRAKVPIVKFVDASTHLHVDISFENDSGLVANETFLNWTHSYPALPPLVLVLKHFLAMRGLNEVYSGGIGSFTVTCLLVSLHQLLPSVTSGRVQPRHNLGLMLMEFLDLYGTHFDTRHTGIRVDPANPGYFRKETVFPLTGAQRSQRNAEDLLCIQDPNNPENDISRSSYHILTVLETFQEAFTALKEKMDDLHRQPFEKRAGRSLLGSLVGGDYKSVELQRERMREIYIDLIGPESDLFPPPTDGGAVPPPPPPPPTNKRTRSPPPKKRERSPPGKRGGGGRGGRDQGMQIKGRAPHSLPPKPQRAEDSGPAPFPRGGNGPVGLRRGRGGKVGTKINPINLE